MSNFIDVEHLARF